MTESPLAVLLMAWCELSGPRDALVPKLPVAVVPLGTGSAVAEETVSFDSLPSLEFLSPFFLT